MASTHNPVEKPSLSFFKRPIRMMRDKKGPPSPLLMNDQHHPSQPSQQDPPSLSIKSAALKINTTFSPHLIRPKISSIKTLNDLSKPSSHHPPIIHSNSIPNSTPNSIPNPSSPLLYKSPSASSSGSKLNSLLNAAARSIRTGDSKILESFQAAIASPRPAPHTIQSYPQLISQPLTQDHHHHLHPHSHPHPHPHPHPTVVLSNTSHSLRRIPVPPYHHNLSNDIHQDHPSSKLSRATSFDRPRTATKHSRAASLPFTQISRSFQPDPNPNSNHNHNPNPDHSLLLPSTSQELSDDFNQLPDHHHHHIQDLSHPSIPHPFLDPSAVVGPNVHQTPSTLPPQPSPRSERSKLSNSLQPNPSPSIQNPSSRPSPSPSSSSPSSSSLSSSSSSSSSSIPLNGRTSTLSYESFREMVSRALGSPFNHHLHYHHHPTSMAKVSSDQPPSQSFLPTPNRESDPEDDPQHHHHHHQPSDPVSAPDSIILDKESNPGLLRDSFLNMPLPALPVSSTPGSHPNLELPPIDPNHVRTQQPRPWSMITPGSFGSQNELVNLWPKFNGHETMGTMNPSPIPTQSSPSKFSMPPARRTRHSFHVSPVSNLSPLDHVSNLTRRRTSRRTSDLTPPNKQVEYRENKAFRSTPSITPHPTTLIFGFRGEVYELEKCRPESIIHTQPIPMISSINRERSDPAHHSTSTTAHSSQTIIPQAFANNRQMSTLVEDDDEDARSTGIPNCSIKGKNPSRPSEVDHIKSNPPGLLSKVEGEFEETGQFIELNEICLMGREDGYHSNDDLEPLKEKNSLTESIPPPSPSEGKLSKLDALGNSNDHRGSSERERSRSFNDTRSLNRNFAFDFSSEPKVISPETSLEMAASILGRPVPSVSKEIWKGLERIRLLSEGRSMEAEGLALSEILERLFECGSATKPSTTEAVVQTDPVELGTRNHHFVLQPPCIIRKSSTRRVADTLKRLAQRNEKMDLISKDNLALNLTRHSFYSEQSFVSTSRVSLSSFRDGGKDDQHDTPRTSGGTPSPRSDFADRFVWKRQISDEVAGEDLNPMCPTTRTPHSIHISDFSRSPIKSLTNFEPHPTTRLCHASLTSSPTLDETVLDALDNALRAEETFQREKQHLQSVARHQSQTIESLLVDKEVLTLEVTRLTGLVELLARDHNLLNERIERGEQFAFQPNHQNPSRRHDDDESYPSSKLLRHQSTITPDETTCYFTTTTGAGEMMIQKKEQDHQNDKEDEGKKKKKEDGIASSSRNNRNHRKDSKNQQTKKKHHHPSSISRSRSLRFEVENQADEKKSGKMIQVSETDEGILPGDDSLDSNSNLDLNDDDDSLCDPENTW